jgi:hypothetical protein
MEGRLQYLIPIQKHFLNMLFSYQWGGKPVLSFPGILSYQGKLKNSLKGSMTGLLPKE